MYMERQQDFASSRNDASSSAMMACLKGAVVIDALKVGMGSSLFSWRRAISAGRWCPRDGNLGVSNTRCTFPPLCSEMLILFFSLNIDERLQ